MTVFRFVFKIKTHFNIVKWFVIYVCIHFLGEFCVIIRLILISPLALQYHDAKIKDGAICNKASTGQNINVRVSLEYVTLTIHLCF